MTATERAQRHYVDVMYAANEELNRAIATYVKTVAKATVGYERQLAEARPVLVTV